MLLQPEAVLEERVLSVQSLADYIQAVDTAANDALSKQKPQPAGGYLVLAIRPGNKSMVWLDFKPTLPTSIASKLRKTILAVPAFDARNGVVVFALNASLWGARSNPGAWKLAHWSIKSGRTLH